MNPNDWIEVHDNALPYKLSHFAVPTHYEADLENILLPHGVILDRYHRFDFHEALKQFGRVEKLAQLIVRDYFERHSAGQESAGLVLICVLKGGHQFFADLLNVIKRLNQSSPRSVPIALEFFKIKSYHNDKSTGSVSIEFTSSETWSDIQKRFKGKVKHGFSMVAYFKDLLIVEDIVDTGKTMTALLEKLKQVDAASVKVSSLFLKRTPLSCGYVPDYVGFSIPDKFIVGYCLDYNEFFRDLDHVCVINDHGKQKYKE